MRGLIEHFALLLKVSEEGITLRYSIVPSVPLNIEHVHRVLAYYYVQIVGHLQK
jgi:hypothetical protein